MFFALHILPKNCPGRPLLCKKSLAARSGEVRAHVRVGTTGKKPRSMLSALSISLGRNLSKRYATLVNVLTRELRAIVGYNDSHTSIRQQGRARTLPRRACAGRGSRRNRSAGGRKPEFGPEQTGFENVAKTPARMHGRGTPAAWSRYIRPCA